MESVHCPSASSDQHTLHPALTGNFIDWIQRNLVVFVNTI